MTGKACSKCLKVLPLTDFGRDKNRKDGHRGICRECVRADLAAKKAADPEAFKAKNRAKYLANAEATKARATAYRLANPQWKKDYDKAYAAANKEKIATRLNAWKAKNPNATKDWLAARPGYSTAWKRANPEKVTATIRRGYAKARLDPKKKVESAIRAGMVKGLNKGAKASRRTFDILGYTLADLTAHLESKFLPGMTWDNYGRGGWHVDHKVPLSVHNYTTPDDLDFKRAWALSNLQPLWQFDNISKHAKLDEPFQPTLAFGIPANDNNIPAAKAA